MPAFKDLTGKRFERLVAVSKANRRTAGGNKVTYWNCKCDCGNIKQVSTGHLSSGRTVSCGCFKAEGYWSREFIDLTGQRVGRLTVLGRGESQKDKRGTRRTMWRVKCDCSPDKEFLVNRANLRGGSTQSCGCYQKEQTAKYGRKEPFKTPYRNLVRAAEKRGITVALTLEQYQSIAADQPPCHYCELPIVWAAHNSPESGRGHNLDRKDSGTGYTVENVVPCCAGCNESKMCRSYAEWVFIGKAIKSYREGRNRE
jgi:hypothetical protein